MTIFLTSLNIHFKYENGKNNSYNLMYIFSYTITKKNNNNDSRIAIGCVTEIDQFLLNLLLELGFTLAVLEFGA